MIRPSFWALTCLLGQLASAQTTERIDGPLPLARAIEVAGERSPRILAAVAERNASNEARRGALARLGPQLSASGFGVSSKPGTMLSGPAMPAPTMSFASGSSWVGNLMLMMPLYTGGQLGAAAEAARHEAQAMAAEEAEMRGETTLMATDAYLNVLLARAKVSRELARVAATAEMVRVTQARADAGKDIAASVRRAEAEHSMAVRELAMARNDEAKMLLDLLATLGVSLDSKTDPADGFSASAVPSLQRLLALAKEHRGLIAGAQAKLKAAASQVRAAQGMQRPQVFGVLMADAANDPMMRGASAGISIGIPIFDGGERKAEVRKMKSMQTAAEQNLRQAELNVEREIRQALLDLDLAKSNAESARAALASASASLEIVKIRYEAGKAILLEQIDAIQAKSSAEAEVARAAFDAEMARARLAKAVGLSLPELDKIAAAGETK